MQRTLFSVSKLAGIFSNFKCLLFQQFEQNAGKTDMQRTLFSVSKELCLQSVLALLQKVQVHLG